MSGTPVSPFTLDDNEVLTAEEVSAEDGCKVEEGREYVRCMQKLPLERILAGDVAVAVSSKINKLLHKLHIMIHDESRTYS